MKNKTTILIALILGLTFSVSAQESENTQKPDSTSADKENVRDVEKTNQQQLALQSIYSVPENYLIDRFGYDSTDIEEVKHLVSNDMRKGKASLNFVGDANIENSLNSGSDIAANTGIGLSLDRFWFGETNIFRSFDLNLSINVASTTDTIFAEVNSLGAVTNQRDFGSYLLTPRSTKQSATLSGSAYFNDFESDERDKKIFKYISGFMFEATGSNSNWVLESSNINLAALAVKLGIFHEFIPDHIRYHDGYSIILGLSRSWRTVLGDLSFESFKDTKLKLLNTDRTSFSGYEFTSKFRFKNVVAQVSIPILSGSEVPGLTGSQFITSISFVGGFPLKLNEAKKQESEENGESKSLNSFQSLGL